MYRKKNGEGKGKAGALFNYVELKNLIQMCEEEQDVDVRAGILFHINSLLPETRRLKIPTLITNDYISKALSWTEEIIHSTTGAKNNFNHYTSQKYTATRDLGLLPSSRALPESITKENESTSQSLDNEAECSIGDDGGILIYRNRRKRKRHTIMVCINADLLKEDLLNKLESKYNVITLNSDDECIERIADYMYKGGRIEVLLLQQISRRCFSMIRKIKDLTPTRVILMTDSQAETEEYVKLFLQRKYIDNVVKPSTHNHTIITSIDNLIKSG